MPLIWQLFPMGVILEHHSLITFNIQSVTNIESMFSVCRSLIPDNLSPFNIQSVTNMNVMHSRRSSLAIINLSSFND